MPIGDKLRQLQALLQQADTGLKNALVQPTGPTMFDRAAAAAPPVEGDTGLSGLGRLGQFQARGRVLGEKEEQESALQEGKLGEMAGREAMFQATAALRESQSGMQDLKASILQATTPEEIQMAGAKLANVKADTQRKLADAQYQAGRATWEPQYRLLDQQIKLYRANLDELDTWIDAAYKDKTAKIAQQNADTNRQRANTYGQDVQSLTGYRGALASAAGMNAETARGNLGVNQQNARSLEGLRGSQIDLNTQRGRQFKVIADNLESMGVSPDAQRVLLQAMLAASPDQETFQELARETPGSPLEGIQVEPPPSGMQKVFNLFGGSGGNKVTVPPGAGIQRFQSGIPQVPGAAPSGQGGSRPMNGQETQAYMSMLPAISKARTPNSVVVVDARGTMMFRKNGPQPGDTILQEPQNGAGQ